MLALPANPPRLKQEEAAGLREDRFAFSLRRIIAPEHQGKRGAIWGRA